VIEPALPEIGRLASFILFLALGVRVSLTRGGLRRRAVAAFIGYVIAINAVAGITQIDNWPFTNNTLAVGRMRDDHPLRFIVFRGLDREGREWRLDPESFTPVFDSILQNWLSNRYPRLDGDRRLAAGRFLVARANETRARLHAGGRIGFERLLGPLACGYWWLLPRAREAPDGDYRSIRVYRLDYRLSEIEKHGRILRETLLLELRG
jgi:hypothetical protein